MFGYATDKEEDTGLFYMFWNLERVMGKPVLSALITGTLISFDLCRCK